MPPEALKENKYSFSSDIWAIAVILFEMLKGYPPWRARSEQMLYSKLLNEPID
jgi:serine/threonine protein kinase